MLRYFAKQLKEKHTELHALEDPELRAEIEKEFNGLISLEKFMALAEIEQKDVQVSLVCISVVLAGANVRAPY